MDIFNYEVLDDDRINFINVNFNKIGNFQKLTLPDNRILLEVLEDSKVKEKAVLDISVNTDVVL